MRHTWRGGLLWIGLTGGVAFAQTPSGAGNVNSFANVNPLPPEAQGPTPRHKDGTVDLSGLWRPADHAVPSQQGIAVR